MKECEWLLFYYTRKEFLILPLKVKNLTSKFGAFGKTLNALNLNFIVFKPPFSKSIMFKDRMTLNSCLTFAIKL